MKIQLIKIAEQENQPLFLGLYSLANQAGVGVIRDGKIVLSTEEYLFLIKQLTEPRGGTDTEMMEWQVNYQGFAMAVASEFNAVFVYQ